MTNVLKPRKYDQYDSVISFDVSSHIVIQFANMSQIMKYSKKRFSMIFFMFE